MVSLLGAEGGAVVVDDNNASVLEQFAAHIRGGASEGVVLFLVVAGGGGDASHVAAMADGGLVVQEALLGRGANTRQIRVLDPGDAGPLEHGLLLAIETLHGHIVSGGEFFRLHQVGVERRGDQTEQIRAGNGVVAQDDLGLHRQSEGSGGRDRAGVLGAGVQLGDDVLIDLAIQHGHRGFLHDPAAIALGCVQVETSATDQIVPLGQRRGRLGQVVSARRDQTVHATGGGLGGTGVSDQESNLIALDLALGGDGVAEQGFALLEARDEFIAVLRLECGFGHDWLLKRNGKISPIASRGSQLVGRIGCPLLRGDRRLVGA